MISAFLEPESMMNIHKIDFIFGAIWTLSFLAFISDLIAKARNVAKPKI